MAVAGHFSVSVADLFAGLGSGIAALSGLLFGVLRGPGPRWPVAWGGAIVGAAAALLALLVSYLLGDVPAGAVRLGTTGAALAGSLGALLGNLTARRE
jgi:hypothetical protein